MKRVCLPCFKHCTLTALRQAVAHVENRIPSQPSSPRKSASRSRTPRPAWLDHAMREEELRSEEEKIKEFNENQPTDFAAASAPNTPGRAAHQRGLSGDLEVLSV